MLVLTRKKGERVMIGDDIVITLIDVRGDGVRIGFDAPRGVKIQRAEVIKAVSEANTEAAASSAEAGELLVGLLAAAHRTDAAPRQRTRTTTPDDAPAAAEPSARGGDGAEPTAPGPTPAADAGGRPKPAPRRPRS